MMACLSPPLTCTGITEFIDGNPLSPDKKIDQIRLNVINGGFFKLHISGSKLTEIIHGGNSRIHQKLKDLPDDYGIVIREIEEAFTELYPLPGLNIKPRILYSVKKVLILTAVHGPPAIAVIVILGFNLYEVILNLWNFMIHEDNSGCLLDSNHSHNTNTIITTTGIHSIPSQPVRRFILRVRHYIYQFHGKRDKQVYDNSYKFPYKFHIRLEK